MPSPERAQKQQQHFLAGQILTEPSVLSSRNTLIQLTLYELQRYRQHQLPNTCSPVSTGVRDKHLATPATSVCPRGAAARDCRGVRRLLHGPTGHFAQPQRTISTLLPSFSNPKSIGCISQAGGKQQKGASFWQKASQLTEEVHQALCTAKSRESSSATEAGSRPSRTRSPCAEQSAWPPRSPTLL